MISIASQQNYFDLSKPYYILAAYGPISSGKRKKTNIYTLK
jgi:hypothetical protein